MAVVRMGQTVMVTESQQARQDNQLLFIISTDDIREGFNLGGEAGGLEGNRNFHTSMV